MTTWVAQFERTFEICLRGYVVAVPPTTEWKYAAVQGYYPVDFQHTEDIPRAPSRDAINLIPDFAGAGEFPAPESRFPKARALPQSPQRWWSS